MMMLHVFNFWLIFRPRFFFGRLVWKLGLPQFYGIWIGAILFSLHYFRWFWVMFVKQFNTSWLRRSNTVVLYKFRLHPPEINSTCLLMIPMQRTSCQWIRWLCLGFRNPSGFVWPPTQGQHYIRETRTEVTDIFYAKHQTLKTNSMYTCKNHQLEHVRLNSWPFLLLVAQDLAAAYSFARSLTEQGFARSEVSCSGSLQPRTETTF